MTHLTSASIFYIELTYKTRKNPPKIFFSFDCTASFGCEPPDAAPCPASAARRWSADAAGTAGWQVSPAGSPAASSATPPVPPAAAPSPAPPPGAHEDWNTYRYKENT